jgi:hypothetical protein
MKISGLNASGALIIALLAGMAPLAARADDAPAQTDLQNFLDSVKFSGHADAGATFNPRVANGGDNMGALFQDKANEPMLNQLMGTAQRAIDSQSDNFNWGFTLTGMYGTDARYTHSFTVMDHLIHSRAQVDVVEASADFHAPVLPTLFEHGVDLKVGIIPSPMGAEVIDSTGNYLYSHSYIFNFGVPYKNTGFLATAHVNSIVDLYGGMDTGVNAFIGDNGYNNNLAHGQFGFGLNLLGGDLTILGFSHIGEENPSNLAGATPGGLRYLNDITTTYKATSDLTLTTDINYIADDGIGAIGYGAAQYAIYALNDHISLVGRGEVWRDNGGAFVASFPGNFDFDNAQRGLPATAVSGGHTTYGELTVGVNWKPEVPKAIDGTVVRPELRADDALNGTHPYNNGHDGFSFTPAVDVVVPF